MAQIYISYSQSNQEAAGEIRDALEGWGHTVWMDDPEVEFDRALAERLDRALREAQIVIALLSPTSVKSRTVRREIALAKSLNTAIIPVLVEPLPSVQESGGAKYIDATTNRQAAISRLVKAVESRAASISARPPAAVPEMEREEAPRSRSTLLAAIMIILVVIVVALGIALGGQRRTSTDDALLTQVESTNAAQATSAAKLRSTADAQATTIGILGQTQTAAASQPTQAVQLPTDTESAPAAGPTSTEIELPTSTAEVPLSSPTTESGTVGEATPTRESAIVVSPTSTLGGEGALPTPTIDLADAQSRNLLTNPGFESFVPLGDNAPGEAAQGWTPWFLTGGDLPSYQAPPTYGAAGANPDRVYGGINAQQYYSEFQTHDAGLYQRVTDITPGSTLRFSVYAYIWSSTFDDINVSEEDGDATFQVGIDPTGGDDPASPNVVWSVPAERYDAYNEYVVIAVAAGDAVTVFVRSKVDFPVRNTYVFVDEALLFAMQ